MPNNTAIRPDNWRKYLATIDQVEAMTGYDFFSNVSPEVQEEIESRLDPTSNTSPNSVAGGTYTDLFVGDRPQASLTGNVTVTGTLDLGPSIIKTGNFRITLAPGATFSRDGGFVEGEFERQFNTTGSFGYPVGDGGSFSPVVVEVTALGTVPSALTVEAVEGAQPNAPNPNAALKRYWTLTETGDLTANLTFLYLQGDIPTGLNESTLKINRYEGGFTELPTTLDTANNFASTPGVTQFSDWTLLGQLAPTAAHVNVGGRVTSANGRAVAYAIVTLTNSQGEVRAARTNGFGYYGFTDVPAGSVYVLGATHKQYSFAPAVLSVSEDMAEADLVAIEP